MTNLIICYVAAFFVPLLFRSRRVAVMGLGVQGILLASILAVGHYETFSWQEAFEFASLMLIRSVFVPWYLFQQMKSYESAPSFALVSKGLTHWLLAFGLLALAFFFASKVAPDDPHETLQVGAAAGSLLIGLLILASQNHPLAQIIGLFTFEGGITLVELLSPHAMPFPVSIGVSLVTVTLSVICGQYLRQLLALPQDSEVAHSEEVR